MIHIMFESIFFRHVTGLTRIAAYTLFLLMFMAPAGYCQEGEENGTPDRGSEVEIEGLVVNQTRSRLGNDFFRYFSSYWLPPQGINGYNIFISDKVHPRFGTWVFIAVNDVTIGRERLESRLWEIEESAKKSVSGVKQYVIMKFGDNKLDAQDEDLAGDGL